MWYNLFKNAKKLNLGIKVVTFYLTTQVIDFELLKTISYQRLNLSEPDILNSFQSVSPYSLFATSICD